MIEGLFMLVGIVLLFAYIAKEEKLRSLRASILAARERPGISPETKAVLDELVRSVSV